MGVDTYGASILTGRQDAEGRPIRNESGYLFAWNTPRQGELSWRRIKVNDWQMTTLLREHNYEAESFFELLMPSGLAGLVVFLIGAVGLIVFDQKLNKKYEEGKFVRGTRLVQPEQFKFEGQSPGLGVPSLTMKKKGWFARKGKDDRIYSLRNETAHGTNLILLFSLRVREFQVDPALCGFALDGFCFRRAPRAFGPDLSEADGSGFFGSGDRENCQGQKSKSVHAINLTEGWANFEKEIAGTG